LKVLIAGAGPAGLYAGILLKSARPEAAIRIVERNPRGATFGFGVVFSDRALDFLGQDDPETLALIAPHMETWADLSIHHRGARIALDGIGFSAIGRLELLTLLQRRLEALGVRAEYETTLAGAAELEGHDLVIAADGVNSFVRDIAPGRFGTQIDHFETHFAWWGTTRVFDTLSQTFVESEHGAFNAHHYRYAPAMSTFITETDAGTFARLGLAEMSEADSKALCERVFAETLKGQALISNRSIWRRFPRVTNARWHDANTVLVGDAKATAHFSIGSGTRLAIEDVIALVKSLRAEDWHVAHALPRYEAERRPVVEKLVGAADLSARWYESFAEQMRLPPWELAWSYVQRTGRVDPERLRRISPNFVAGYEAYRQRTA
jgi:2-polyprenyl-6-methoxyphenol hydroxylase-like FAD-dependent oxidoreductase